MYREIRQHPTTLQIYADKLIAEGTVTKDEVEALRAEWRQRIDDEFEAGQAYKPNKADWLDGKWSGLKQAADSDDPRRGRRCRAWRSARDRHAALHHSR